MATQCSLKALTLLLLWATQVHSEENQSSLYCGEAATVAAMREVSQAMQCFGETVKDSQHSVLHEMLQVKEQMDQLNRNFDRVKRDIAEIQKIQDLESKIGEYQRRVFHLEEKNNELKDTVEILKTAGWTPDCEQPHILEIKKEVQAFNHRRDWNALKTRVSALLDHSSETYRQLQNVESVYDVGGKGYVELATLLLCGGLPVDSANHKGQTMLHGAARRGQLQLVNLLLDHKASVNVRTTYNFTPFIGASVGGYIDVAKRLVQAGADIKAKTVAGDTALDWANKESHTALAQYLKQLNI